MMEAATGSTEKYWERRREAGQGELLLLHTKGLVWFNPAPGWFCPCWDGRRATGSKWGKTNPNEGWAEDV